MVVVLINPSVSDLVRSENNPNIYWNKRGVTSRPSSNYLFKNILSLKEKNSFPVVQ